MVKQTFFGLFEITFPTVDDKFPTWSKEIATERPKAPEASVSEEYILNRLIEKDAIKASAAKTAR